MILSLESPRNQHDVLFITIASTAVETTVGLVSDCYLKSLQGVYIAPSPTSTPRTLRLDQSIASLSREDHSTKTLIVPLDSKTRAGPLQSQAAFVRSPAWPPFLPCNFASFSPWTTRTADLARLPAYPDGHLCRLAHTATLAHTRTFCVATHPRRCRRRFLFDCCRPNTGRRCREAFEVCVHAITLVGSCAALDFLHFEWHHPDATRQRQGEKLQLDDGH